MNVYSVTLCYASTGRPSIILSAQNLLVLLWSDQPQPLHKVLQGFALCAGHTLEEGTYYASRLLPWQWASAWTDCEVRASLQPTITAATGPLALTEQAGLGPLACTSLLRSCQCWPGKSRLASAQRGQFRNGERLGFGVLIP